MQSTSVHSFATRAVHFGHDSEKNKTAMLTPIVQSTTFAQGEIGEAAPHSYSRVSNPTVHDLERSIANLDGANYALCFATGMSATTALFIGLLGSGDEVIVSDVVYGGTTRLLDEILEPFGVRAIYVDSSDKDAVEAAITSQTKLIFIETPANPTLKLSDVKGVAAVGAKHNVPVAVDNTFLTPYLQPCREYGCCITLYSTTKYFDGHNATVGGAIAVDDEELYQKLLRVRKTLGLNQKPFEAWLTLQGLQTLPLRVERQSQTSLELAQWLESRPEVSRVIYPGLASHPQADLAQQQQKAGGAIIAFELASGLEGAKAFVSSVKLITLAENLGAAQSIITHPATMTHADLDPEAAAKVGITPGLVRLSVGLESFADLAQDIQRAFPVTQGSKKQECQQ